MYLKFENENTYEVKKMDSEDEKKFIESIMNELDLKGAKIKRLIKIIAEKENYDPLKIKVAVKKALIGT